jgi:hypothetical protein
VIPKKPSLKRSPKIPYLRSKLRSITEFFSLRRSAPDDFIVSSEEFDLKRLRLKKLNETRRLLNV